MQRNLTDESIPETEEEENKEAGSEGQDADVTKEDDGDFIDVVDQGLAIRVSIPTYRLFFEPNTADYFTRKVGVSSNSSSDAAEAKEKANGMKCIKARKDGKRSSTP